MDSAGLVSEANVIENSLGSKGCGYGVECSFDGYHRGICPEGWHVPSHDEFSTLFSAVGGSATAATKLKSTEVWNEGYTGTDDYGFKLLPAGYRSEKKFSRLGIETVLWTVSPASVISYGKFEYYAQTADFSYSYDYPTYGNFFKYVGYSLRCLKD